MKKHRVARYNYYLTVLSAICIVVGMLILGLVFLSTPNVNTSIILISCIIFGIGIIDLCISIAYNPLYSKFCVDTQGFTFCLAKTKQIRWDDLKFYGIIQWRPFGFCHYITYVYGAKSELSLKEAQDFLSKATKKNSRLVFFQYTPQAFSDFIECVPLEYRNNLMKTVQNSVEKMTKAERFLHR